MQKNYKTTYIDTSFPLDIRTNIDYIFIHRSNSSNKKIFRRYTKTLDFSDVFNRLTAHNECVVIFKIPSVVTYFFI